MSNDTRSSVYARHLNPRLGLLAILALTGVVLQADPAWGQHVSSSGSSRKASPSSTAKSSLKVPRGVSQAAAIDDDNAGRVSLAACKNCQNEAGVEVAHEQHSIEAAYAEDDFADATYAAESSSPACAGGACRPWGLSIVGGCDDGCNVGCLSPCSPLAILSRRLYMRAEATYFWGSGQFLPTLVTTSDAQTLPPIEEAGLLDDPDTRSLFGGEEVGTSSSNGIRYEVGLWLDDCRSRGFLVRMFDTGENDISLQTDGTRQAVIARNFLDVGPPSEQSLVSIAYPNQTRGSISANLSSTTNGGDVLLRHAIAQDHLGRWDWLVGYQTARLSESLDIVSNTTNLNAPNPMLDQEDHFQVRSQFHGAAMGFGGEVREGNWYLGGLFKMGLGNMERRVEISGLSRTTVGTDVASQDQGLLARQTNAGTYRQDTFVVVPELGLQYGYRLSGRLDFTVGYSLLRLPKVGRVADTLDPDLASNLSDPLTGDISPSFTQRESNFTLHSLNLGLQWAY